MAKGMIEVALKDFKEEISRRLDTRRGRPPKSVPPEGSDLVIAVESIGMRLASKQVDKIILPGLAAVAHELNRLPEYRQQKRRVIKGGQKRRVWTENSLTQQLIDDGTPWTKIRERLTTNLS